MKNKITVIDKKGNEKEYEVKDNLLLPGERIFKKNGTWYVTKILDKNSDLMKWIEETKPEVYDIYNMKKDKKIEHGTRTYDITKFVNDYEEAGLFLKEVGDKIYQIIDYINEEKNKTLD